VHVTLQHIHHTDMSQTFLEFYKDALFFQMSVQALQGMGPSIWWLQGSVRVEQDVYVKNPKQWAAFGLVGLGVAQWVNKRSVFLIPPAARQHGRLQSELFRPRRKFSPLATPSLLHSNSRAQPGRRWKVLPRPCRHFGATDMVPHPASRLEFT
jgi:hypothetical protein